MTPEYINVLLSVTVWPLFSIVLFIVFVLME